MSIGRTVLWSTLFVLFVSGCGEGGGEPDHGYSEQSVVHFDTLLFGAEGTLGAASDMELDGSGNIWIADRMNHRLVVVDPQGERIRFIGREGKGPGEFQGPSAISVSDSVVLVLDFGKRALQTFSFDGTHLETIRIAERPLLPATLNPRGDLAFATLGRDSSLLAVLPYKGGDELAAPHLLGEPSAPPPKAMSAAAIKQQVSRGEIPTEFQNNVLPILGPEGKVWAVLQSLGTVQHFDQDGRLIWSRPVPDSLVASARAEFVRAWEAEDRRGYPVPWTVRSGRLVQDDLWLLHSLEGEGREATLLVLDGASGRLKRSITLATGGLAGPFGVDLKRGRIYLVLPNEASLVAADLP